MSFEVRSFMSELQMFGAMKIIHCIDCIFDKIILTSALQMQVRYSLHFQQWHLRYAPYKRRS